MNYAEVTITVATDTGTDDEQSETVSSKMGGCNLLDIVLAMAIRKKNESLGTAAVDAGGVLLRLMEWDDASLVGEWDEVSKSLSRAVEAQKKKNRE